MKPRIKGMLWGVASLAVVFLVTCWIVVRSWQREFAAELQGLEARGAALHSRVLAPPLIPDFENAAPLVAEAATLLDRKDREGEDDDWDKLLEEKAEDPEALSRLVAARGAYYKKIAEALARPRCRYPVDYEKGFLVDNPLISDLVPCATLLRARATLALRKGDSGSAAQDLKRILRLSGTLGGEPLQISQFVRYRLQEEAFDLLAADRLELKPDEWKDLARAFEAQTFQEDFARAIEMERAMAVELYGNLLSRGRVPTMGLPEAAAPGVRWFAPKVGTAALNLLTRAIDLLRKPYSESRADVERIHAEMEAAQSWYQVRARLLMPAYSRGFGSMARAQSMQRAAAAFCRLKSDGNLPAVLEVIDPLTGKPMIYRREGSGFELRGVGTNLKDDGGAEDDIVLKSRN